MRKVRSGKVEPCHWCHVFFDLHGLRCGKGWRSSWYVRLRQVRRGVRRRKRSKHRGARIILYRSHSPNHRPLRLHRLQRRVLLGPKRTDKRMQVLPSRQVCQRERLGKMQGLPNRSLRRQAGRDARRTGQRVRRPLCRGPLRQQVRSNISAVRGPMPQGKVQPPWGYQVPSLPSGEVWQCHW